MTITRLWIALALTSFLNPLAQPAPPYAPQIYGHRGMRSFAPENSLPGYRAALKIGVDFVDMDVVLTRDGEVLVSHDPLLSSNITRMPDGKYVPGAGALSPAETKRHLEKYAVKNLNLAELQTFDIGRMNPASAYEKFFPDQVPADGTKMPTLREVIQLVKSSAGKEVSFQIEMKTDPEHPETSADPEAFSKSLYKVLKSENIVDRAEIQAFDFRCLYALQALDRSVKTAYLTSTENDKGAVLDLLHRDQKVAGLWTGGKLLKDYGSIPKMIKALGGYAWEPEDAQLTRDALAEAKALGLKVVVWTWPERLGTAFDPKLVEKMIQWGVDGIITDDPGRLRSMLAARGMRVPMGRD